MRDRVLIGIAGAPGAGKTTLADAIVTAARSRGIAAVSVPMDGFHLADVELDRLGLRARKGALETFDGDGYVSLLERLRPSPGSGSGSGSGIVYAPAFDREIEQPIAGAIAIPPETRLIVTEGNYLLDDEGPWDRIAGLADEVWFVQVDDERRRERLRARHVRFGKTEPEAARWVDEVDEPNARRVTATRDRAARIVELD